MILVEFYFEFKWRTDLSGWISRNVWVKSDLDMFFFWHDNRVLLQQLLRPAFVDRTVQYRHTIAASLNESLLKTRPLPDSICLIHSIDF